MSHLQAVSCPHCNERLFHDGSIAGRDLACSHCGGTVHIPDDHRWHNDPVRQIHDESLALDGEIYGQAPVQADGRICGHQFYFRAKWDNWEFTVSLNADIDASCLNPPDTNGFFQEGEYRGFNVGEAYSEASFMRYDNAEAIIKRCGKKLSEAMDNPETNVLQQMSESQFRTQVLNPCPMCGKRFDCNGCMTFVDEFLDKAHAGNCPECGTHVVIRVPYRFQTEAWEKATTLLEIRSFIIEELDLSVRTKRSLEQLGITTIGQLLESSEQTIREKLVVSDSVVEEIHRLLASKSLSMESP